jgi:hypothetical protein
MISSRPAYRKYHNNVCFSAKCTIKIDSIYCRNINLSDDGLIDKPKLVTCKSVNFVVHDGDLCIYIYIYIYIYLKYNRDVSTKKRLISKCGKKE